MMRQRRDLPIDIPGKVICVGLNYRAHAQEAGEPIPDSPILFAKWSSCLIGDREPILLPEVSTQVDYEAELACVIGAEASHVGVGDALNHVAGYLIMNDVTARDVQARDGQWTRSKSFDTFGPIGPRLVPASDIPDPQALAIRAWLNDDLVQDSTTADMIFSVAEIIAYISAGITLYPGDLVTTGTPSGVGLNRTPPRMLRSGDVFRIAIDGLGDLENPIR